MASATLFKHLLNLHFPPAMSTAPNHPMGSGPAAPTRWSSERNRTERVKDDWWEWKHNPAQPHPPPPTPPNSFAWRVWLREVRESRATTATSCATDPRGEKPQTRLQRPGITVTCPLPVIPWLRCTIRMERLGNGMSQTCLHSFLTNGWWKETKDGPWPPQRLLTFSGNWSLLGFPLLESWRGKG